MNGSLKWKTQWYGMNGLQCHFVHVELVCVSNKKWEEPVVESATHCHVDMARSVFLVKR